MIDVLVDTSVWVGHFREADDGLIDLLASDRVLVHPLVIGELACGTPPDRTRTLTDLERLRPTEQPSFREMLAFLERRQLYGLGCGYVDIVLLAATLMTTGAVLWTRDKRLTALAVGLGIAHRPVQK